MSDTLEQLLQAADDSAAPLDVPVRSLRDIEQRGRRANAIRAAALGAALLICAALTWSLQAPTRSTSRGAAAIPGAMPSSGAPIAGLASSIEPFEVPAAWRIESPRARLALERGATASFRAAWAAARAESPSAEQRMRDIEEIYPGTHGAACARLFLETGGAFEQSALEMKRRLK